MNEPTKIPCTVAVLTRNSGKTLKRCLESAKAFVEVIVCDANSTDETLTIAASYGARVIRQDTRFLTSAGRIVHFGNVRNQTLAAATHDWFFFLDSDEYLGPEVIEEIRQKTTEAPAAFWVPRKYVYRGVVIDQSVSYPSQQMRFFNLTVANAFIKEVHEKIELLPGVVAKRLQHHMFVPLPDTASEMISRWRQYLAIENSQRAPISFLNWLRGAIHEGAIAVRYLLRGIRILLASRGTRLPLSFELARIWYQYRLIADSFKKVRFFTNQKK